MTNPNIFRMYDIRGIADQDLTDETVTLIGKAFGTYIRRKGCKRITVGRDVRLSSERIKNAVIAGVTSTGIDDNATSTIPVVLRKLS